MRLPFSLGRKGKLSRRIRYYWVFIVISLLFFIAYLILHVEMYRSALDWLIGLILNTYPKLGFWLFAVNSIALLMTSYLIVGMANEFTMTVRILSMSTVATGLMIAILLILGAVVQELTIHNITLSNGLLLFAIALINTAKWKRKEPSKRSPWKEVRNAVENLRGFQMGTIQMVALLLTVAGLLWVILTTAILPVWDWDGIMYHLFLPASWIKARRIYIPSAPDYGLLNLWMYYPGNSELIYGWMLILLGDDAIIESVQLVYAMIAALSLYNISRMIGIKSKHSLWVFALFLSTPAVFIQSRTCCNDLVFAAFAVQTAYFLMMYLEGRRTSYLLLSGFSLGILAGVKYTGLFYVIAYTLLLISTRIASKDIKSLFRELLVFCSLTLALCCFWYMRNYVLTGNPIYPYTVEIFNYQVFKGAISPGQIRWLGEYGIRPEEWIFYALTEGSYLYDRGGFGIQFASLLLPSYALTLINIFSGKKYKDLRRFVTFIFLPIVNISSWILQPYKFVRFLFPIIGVGSISVCYVYQQVTASSARRLLEVIVLASVFLSLTASMPRIGWQTELKSGLEHFFNTCKVPVQYDLLNYGEEGQGWRWINSHTYGDVIAYTHTNLPYFLFGEGLKNNVVFLESTNYETWLRSAFSYDVSFLFIVRRYPYEMWPIEDDWARKNPSMFKPVFSNSQVHIYALLRNGDDH